MQTTKTKLSEWVILQHKRSQSGNGVWWEEKRYLESLFMCLSVSAGGCLPCIDAEVRRQPQVLVLAFHLESESLVHCCVDQATRPVSFWSLFSSFISFVSTLGSELRSSGFYSRLSAPLTQAPHCLRQVISEALAILARLCGPV